VPTLPRTRPQYSEPMSRNDLVRWVGEQEWTIWLRSTLFELVTRMATPIGVALAYLLVRAIR
jgi:hypothetical protein